MNKTLEKYYDEQTRLIESNQEYIDYVKEARQRKACSQCINPMQKGVCNCQNREDKEWVAKNENIKKVLSKITNAHRKSFKL